MARASLPPLVVLLAGDELTRSITTSCLEASGYDVLSARTAGEVEALLLSQTALRRVDVLVTDADVRDAVEGVSLGAVARCLDPAVGVIYTTRSPRTLPDAIVAGAPCLRTPYHAHQLVRLIADLPRSPEPGRTAVRRAA
nr:response regulator [Methylobacterium sp. OTU13CASTA1]